MQSIGIIGKIFDNYYLYEQTMSYSRNQIEKNEVAQMMSELKPSILAVRDAWRFEEWIPSEKRQAILARSTRVIPSAVQPIGLGGAALLKGRFSRDYIKTTAKTVRETKAGECHSLAQLAADHLLSKMKSGQMTPRLLQIVTANDGTGSHTFTVLAYTNSDLTEPCLIIDLWAAALGYDTTQGVFTIDDYPFLDMLKNLTSHYDNKDYLEELKKPTATASAAIVSGRHPIYQSPIESKAVDSTFNAISKTKKYSDKVLAHLEKALADEKVQAGLVTLKKKYGTPETINSIVMGLFEHGFGAPYSPIKSTNLTEEERPSVISAARVLNDAHRRGKSEELKPASYRAL